MVGVLYQRSTLAARAEAARAKSERAAFMVGDSRRLDEASDRDLERQVCKCEWSRELFNQQECFRVARVLSNLNEGVTLIGG